MFFKNIPGHEVEKVFLRQIVSERRIPHAQLFLSNEGNGSLALVLAYSSYILCQNRTEDDSCGECPACIKSHKMVHPDLHFAFPVSKKEGLNRDETTSNAFLSEFRKTFLSNPFMTEGDWAKAMDSSSAMNINVRECQEITGKLSLQAFSDGPKIMIIWLPEYLGKEGNRLLKLIEEPTDNTHLFLVTENQSSIMPTILSRCQVVRINAFSDDDIAKYLNNHFQQNLNIEQVVRLSAGNLAKGIKILKGNDTDYSELIINWLRIAYKGDAVAMTDFVNQISSLGKDNINDFLNYCLHFVREHGYLMATGMTPRLNDKEINVSKNIAQFLDFSKIEKFTFVVENTIFGISRNANLKVLFMAQTILIGDILKNNMNNYMNTINFAIQ
jgi:DNA polymerase III subunit delta'